MTVMIGNRRWLQSFDRNGSGVASAMVGILVLGDNHFIVRGPLPDRTAALSLARHWSTIQIGRTMPISLQQWSILTREFRENLEWAVIVPGDNEVTPAVVQLLGELKVRGIAIHDYASDK